MSTISTQAVIEEGAVIGNNVTIGPFAFVGKEVTIGDDTTIGASAHIYGKTTIGKGNEIFSHAVIGSIPQDLKFNGEDVELIIGDYNKIREFTLINPGTEGGGAKTIIGNHNLLMGYVHVAHDCIIGNHCILANAATLAGHVELDDYVVVGGMTPIHQFVKVGTGSMIAGASALSQDVPPYCTVEGNRAKLRGLNLNGIRRRFDKPTINALKEAYNLMFNSGQPLKESAQQLADTSDVEQVKQMAQFVLNTKRGIAFTRDSE
jgi:UDP-N-acetylglucosamine acyltransferase